MYLTGVLTWCKDDIHLVRDTDTSVDLGHIRPENYDNSLVLETDPWIRNKVDLIPSSVAVSTIFFCSLCPLFPMIPVRTFQLQFIRGIGLLHRWESNIRSLPWDFGHGVDSVRFGFLS